MKSVQGGFLHIPGAGKRSEDRCGAMRQVSSGMNQEMQEKLVFDRRPAAVVSVTPQASMPIRKETSATTETCFPLLKTVT